MSTVNEFRKLLPNKFGGEDVGIIQWPGATRRSNHLLEIDYKINPTTLYVKESNISPGFWGLTKNQLDRLNKAQVRWFAVLLLKRNDTGYVLPSNEVNSRIQDRTFELSKDGDYKVNEGTGLNSNMAFRGIADLIVRIL